MEEYNMDLLFKLNRLRHNYDVDDVFANQMIVLFINEIFLRENKDDTQEFDLYLAVKENLKTTIEIILNFFNVEDKNISIDDLSEPFDINDCKEYIKLFNIVNNELDNEKVLTIHNNTLIAYIQNIITFIDNSTNNNKMPICETCNTEMINNNIDTSNNEDIIYQDNFINTNNFKDFVIAKHLIDYKCDICGLSEWQNNYLPLTLNYRDGNKYNQNIENLYFLCPNCHSQHGDNYD